MNLNWGSGSFDVILDLRTGIIMEYTKENKERIHSHYGGKNYYISCSGLSGAGWIPDSPYFRKLSTYRVDTVYGRIELGYIKESIYGYKIIVPIDYNSKEIDRSYPVIILDRSNECYLCHINEVFNILEKYIDKFKSQKYEFFVFPASKKEFKIFNYRIHFNPYYKRLKYKRTLEILFSKDLLFDFSEGYEENRFWNRLGLYSFKDDPCFYKIRRGICQSKYAKEDLDTIEELQAVAPKNTVFITPTFYIQEDSSGFEAVGLFGEVEYEMRIETEDAIRAFSGNYQNILSSLEEHVQEKIKKAKMYTITENKLREFIEENPEVEITLEDSLAAGNCEPGTKNFSERCFQGKIKVTVKELAKYINLSDVKKVLQYKCCSNL